MATITGTSGNDTLNGTNGNDTIYGLAGDDTLNGALGNDVLIGGAGADTLIGGGGVDVASYAGSAALVIDLYDGSQSTGDAYGDAYVGITSYVGSTGNDIFIAGSTATDFRGGIGNDKVDYSLSSTGISLSLYYGGTGIYLTGTGSGGLAQLDSFYAINQFVGTSYDDIYTITSGVDHIAFIETTNGGTDELRTTLDSYTLDSNIENLTYVGVGNFIGTGNASNNTITGGAGDDAFYGEGGADTLSYALAEGAVNIDLGLEGIAQNTGGAGSDAIYSIEGVIGSDYSDTLTGSDYSNVILGGSGNDTIYGVGGNDTLNGGAGDDSVYGGDGNDLLEGGAGADIMQGGLGDDVYIVDNPGDQVIEQANAGNDTVQASVTYTVLGSNVENVTLTGSGNINATGSSVNNTLIGNGGNNVLDGLGGSDTMVGGAGDDTYYINNAGDTVSELANEGVDQIFSTVSVSLGNFGQVEILTLTGGASAAANGNGVANVLVGNNGNNILDGLGGSDQLTGGLGADSFRFSLLLGSSAADIIADFTNAQGDKIELAKSAYTALADYGLGALDPGELTFGTGAATASNHLIYDNSTGALYYDVDGTGSVAQILIATLTGAPTIQASDVVVI